MTFGKFTFTLLFQHNKQLTRLCLLKMSKLSFEGLKELTPFPEKS